MMLNPGDAAPDFSLVGVDDKSYSLSSFSSSSVLVVIFSCNHCPYVKAYEDRFVRIQEEYGPRGVQVICINGNDSLNYPEDSFEEMKHRSSTAGFNFPYLRDETQAVCHAYGAERTPHLFVFDAGRRLAYTGSIDDNWQNPDLVRHHYLQNALEALLDGRKPNPPTTQAIGCTIKWK